jgi:hypothetical protein
MSEPTITERQQFWLEHFQAAEDFDGSLAPYARSAGLKPKELYQWKSILVRRGLLAGSPAPVTAVPAAKPSDFVHVIAPMPATGIRLVLPNDVRLECPAELGSHALAGLIETASRL